MIPTAGVIHAQQRRTDDRLLIFPDGDGHGHPDTLALRLIYQYGAAVLRRCDELEDKLLQCQSRSEREINRLKQELQQCGPSGIDKYHKG